MAGAGHWLQALRNALNSFGKQTVIIKEIHN